MVFSLLEALEHSEKPEDFAMLVVQSFLDLEWLGGEASDKTIKKFPRTGEGNFYSIIFKPHGADLRGVPEIELKLQYSSKKGKGYHLLRLGRFGINYSPEELALAKQTFGSRSYQHRETDTRERTFYIPSTILTELKAKGWKKRTSVSTNKLGQKVLVLSVGQKVFERVEGLYRAYDFVFDNTNLLWMATRKSEAEYRRTAILLGFGGNIRSEKKLLEAFYNRCSKNNLPGLLFFVFEQYEQVEGTKRKKKNERIVAISSALSGFFRLPQDSALSTFLAQKLDNSFSRPENREAVMKNYSRFLEFSLSKGMGEIELTKEEAFRALKEAIRESKAPRQQKDRAFRTISDLKKGKPPSLRRRAGR